VGGVTWIHDADGNLTSYGSATFVYDGENRRKQAGGFTFTYDYRHRVAKQIGNWQPWGHSSYYWMPGVAHRYYDGAKVLYRKDLCGGYPQDAGYRWGPDLAGRVVGGDGTGGLVSVYSGGRTYFPIHDGRGNVWGFSYTEPVITRNLTTFGDGAFNPYQNVPVYVPVSLLGFAHGTKEFIPALGLYLFGRRFYDPKTGRFLNRDPIAEDGGLNLYRFVSNNPVNSWDYNGLEEEEWWGDETIALDPFVVTEDPWDGFTDVDLEQLFERLFGDESLDYGGNELGNTEDRISEEQVHEELLRRLCASIEGRALVDRINREWINIYTSVTAFPSPLSLGFFNSTQYARNGTVDIYVNRSLDTEAEIRELGYGGSGREAEILIIRHEVGEYDAFRAMPGEPAWVRDAHARNDADAFARSAGIAPWFPGMTLNDFLEANRPGGSQPEGYAARTVTPTDFAQMTADKTLLTGWDCSRVRSQTGGAP
jgi:RHS repeat-associated protein